MTKKKSNLLIDNPDIMGEQEETTEIVRELPKTSSAMDLFNDLDSKDKALVNMILQHPAISASQMSKRIGMSEKAIYTRIKNEHFKRCLAGLQRTDLDLYLECRKEAIIVLRDIMMNGESPTLKVQAAKEFMKGIVPDRVQIEDTTGYKLTEDEELEIEKQLGIITRKTS